MTRFGPAIGVIFATAAAAACGFFPEVGALRPVDEAGAAALPGASGTSGTSGSSGTSGTSGSSGTSGTSGSSGTSGTSGSSGTSGTSGTSGSSGTSGTSGSSGIDAGPDASGPQTFTIVVAPGDRDRFDPADLTIRAGDTVRWFWAYGGHSVVGQGGSFCSPNNTNCGAAPEMSRGESYSRRFDTAGSFPFFCAQHDDEMAGIVRVLSR